MRSSRSARRCSLLGAAGIALAARAEAQQAPARPSASAAAPSGAFAMPPGNSPMIQYVTRAGDTCPMIAQRVYGSATRIDVIHTYNTMAAMPHRFRAGVTLNLPRNPPPMRNVADGEVSFVRNDVHAYTPDDHRARTGEPLSRGHRVGTFANSSAVVTLGDERQLQLEENSLVVLLGRFSYQSGRRETAEDTRLESGTLRSALSALSGRPPPQPVVVATPAAAVTASAGQTVVSVNARRETRVSVHEGQAEVRARGRSVTVPAGFANSTASGQRPTAPRALPARPRFTASPARLVFVRGGATDVRATYAPAESAPAPARWRVQLARDERFLDVVSDQRVEGSVTTFEARTLTAGEYFLRALAVDAEQYESAPSEVQRVRVVAPAVRPSAPGRRASVDVGPGLFCALDEAPFTAVTAPVELVPARSHALRCADNAEGREPASFEVSAEDSGAVTTVARAGAPRWDRGRGERDVLIRVMDAAGTALPNVPPSAAWEGSGELTAVTATGEPGTYTSKLRWTGRAPEARLRVSVNGRELSTATLDAVDPPAVSNGTAPGVSPGAPLPVEAPSRWDVGAQLGAFALVDRFGFGLHAGLAARRRITFNRVELYVGLGLGYERFGCSGGPVMPDAYCGAAAAGTASTDVNADVFSAGIPVALGYRVGAHVLPYVTLQPQLMLGRVVTSTNAGGNSEGALRVTGGGLGALGLQLDFRPHTPFVEVGYRYGAFRDDRVGGVSIGGLQGTLGYRVQW